MRLANITLLSIGSIALILTGCRERGEILLPSEKTNVKKKIDKKETFYDFPVLKISANPKEDNSPVPKKTNTEKTLKNATNRPKPLKINENSSIKKNTSIKVSKADTVNKVIIDTKKDSTKQITTKTKKTKDKIKVKPKPKTQSTSKKLQQKRSKAKKRTSSQIPIFSSIIKPDISLQDIPLLNKILPKPSDASKGRIRKSNTQTFSRKNTGVNKPLAKSNASNALPSSNAPVGFSGGTSSIGLDMAKIRIETDNYQTNLILDSYKWVGYNSIPTEASNVSGTYFFRYEPANKRIVGNIKGYNTFSALLAKPDALLKSNPMVKNIYIDRYIGDDSIKFIITLKQEARVNIIDVENPGSIIIELYPIKK